MSSDESDDDSFDDDSSEDELFSSDDESSSDFPKSFFNIDWLFSNFDLDSDSDAESNCLTSDCKAFSNYVIKLLNQEVRTQMGNNSFKFLIKEYNTEITYNKIVNKINLW